MAGARKIAGQSFPPKPIGGEGDETAQKLNNFDYPRANVPFNFARYFLNFVHFSPDGFPIPKHRQGRF